MEAELLIRLYFIGAEFPELIPDNPLRIRRRGGGRERRILVAPCGRGIR